jgi:tetratricopeptide (TPR) repeat protein
MAGLVNWIADRIVKILVLLVVLVTVSFIGYYVWDNYFRPSPSALDQAIEHMEKLIRANPNDPELRAAVAEIYLTNGMYREAITQYQETLKAVADHKGAIFGLGSAYMAIGRNNEAIQYLNRVVEMSKDNEMARLDQRLETAYYYLGQIYLNMGQPEQAVEQLENAIALVPTDADALYLLGRAHQEKQVYNDAINYYARAVNLVPDFKEVYQGMAQCYRALGNEAVAAYPEGMMALLSGKYQEAVQQLEAAIAAKPDLANAFWGLGVAYEKTGQVEQAKGAYQQALAVDPDHIAAQAGASRMGRSLP